MIHLFEFSQEKKQALFFVSFCLSRKKIAMNENKKNNVYLIFPNPKLSCYDKRSQHLLCVWMHIAMILKHHSVIILQMTKLLTCQLLFIAAITTNKYLHFHAMKIHRFLQFLTIAFGLYHKKMVLWNAHFLEIKRNTWFCLFWMFATFFFKAIKRSFFFS